MPVGTHLGEIMAPWGMASSGYTPKRKRMVNESKKRGSIFKFYPSRRRRM
jgi:hypothetical protein